MTNKIQKKLLTFWDSLPWAIITMIAAALTSAAFVSNFNHLDTETIIQLGILGAVDLAVAFIVGLRYDNLWEFIHRWNHAYQTSQGCAIIPNREAYARLRDSKWYPDIEWGADSTNANPFYLKVEQEIDACSKFWGTSPELFKETTISIVDKPFEVKFVGKAMGVQQGQVVQVAFDMDRVKTEDQLLKLIRHEISHRCLTAKGIPEDKHHKVMADTGFC